MPVTVTDLFCGAAEPYDLVAAPEQLVDDRKGHSSPAAHALSGNPPVRAMGLALSSWLQTLASRASHDGGPRSGEPDDCRPAGRYP